MLLCIFCLFGFDTKAQEKALHLRNAYEVAKELYKFNTRTSNFSDSAQQKLLGSLIWYADLQDNFSEGMYTELSKRLSSYTILKNVFADINNQILSIEFIFDSTKTVEVNTLINALNSKIGKEVQSLYKDYVNSNEKRKQLQKEIDEKEKSLVIQNNAKLAIATKINESKYKLDAIEDSISRTTIQSSISTDSMNHLTIEKEIRQLEDIIDQKSKGKTREDSILIESRSQLSTFINKNKTALADFLYALNKKTHKVDPGILLLENSIQAFNRSNQLQEFSINVQGNTTPQNIFSLPSQSEVIDALAIYLSNRIKQESVMWFFETITKNMQQYDLVKIFFPSTLKLLLGNEPYDIPNMGAQWQYALSKDFIQMPRAALTSPWINSKLWKPKQLNYLKEIEWGCALADLVMKQYSYQDVIKELYLKSKSVKTDKTSKNSSDESLFTQYITLLYALNTELILVGADQKGKLLTYEDYRKLNGEELEILLSLIDLKYDKVISKIIFNKSSFTFKKATVTAEMIRQFFGSIKSAIAQVEQTKVAEQTVTNTKDWFYTSYNVWTAFNQLFEVFKQFNSLSHFKDERKDDVSRLLSFSTSIFESYQLISKKNFAGATLTVTDIIIQLIYSGKDSTYQLKLDSALMKKILDMARLKENDKSGDDKTEQQQNDISKKNYTNFSVFKKLITDKEIDSNFLFRFDSDSIIEFKRNSPIAILVFEKDRHAIQMIKKISGFLNDAALAITDKKLAKVVESYAMPAGSYKRKRNAWWSVDLNAFAGGYYGWETSSLSNSKIQGNAYGFTVPIGFSLSKTFGRRVPAKSTIQDDAVLNPDKIKVGKHHLFGRGKFTSTLMFSIVDLAAPVSYRLSNNSTTANPHQFKWSQLLSPGAHIGIAIPSFPLVLSGGIMFTPQLRSFATEPRQTNTLRKYIGIMFDLPLFNLWERKTIISSPK
jgi:hypothetical protein